MSGDSELSQRIEQRRAAMPGLAEIIDWARENFGTEFVNHQIATAQQARREHAQVLAQQGEAAAKRWHRANAHRCTFHGTEAGREVGLPSPFGQKL